MQTDTITRKWKAGAELALKIEAELSSGRATRPALEVERRLVVCRRCDQFRANSCAEIELHPNGPTLCQLLTRQDLHCRRWSAAYQEGRGVRGLAIQWPVLAEEETPGHDGQGGHHPKGRDAGQDSQDPENQPD